MSDNGLHKSVLDYKSISPGKISAHLDNLYEKNTIPNSDSLSISIGLKEPEIQYGKVFVSSGLDKDNLEKAVIDELSSIYGDERIRNNTNIRFRLLQAGDFEDEILLTMVLNDLLEELDKYLGAYSSQLQYVGGIDQLYEGVFPVFNGDSGKIIYLLLEQQHKYMVNKFSDGRLEECLVGDVLNDLLLKMEQERWGKPDSKYYSNLYSKTSPEILSDWQNTSPPSKWKNFGLPLEYFPSWLLTNIAALKPVDLNHAPQKNKATAIKFNRFHKITLALTILLFTQCLGLIIAGGFSLYYHKKLIVILEQASLQWTNIKAVERLVTERSKLQNKLTLINTINNHKTDIAFLMWELEKVIPPSVIFNSLMMKKEQISDNYLIHISGQVSHEAELYQMLEKLRLKPFVVSAALKKVKRLTLKFAQFELEMVFGQLER